MAGAARRVWVFIDSQNVIRDAKQAFHVPSDPASYGHVYPERLASFWSASASSRGFSTRYASTLVLPPTLTSLPPTEPT